MPDLSLVGLFNLFEERFGRTVATVLLAAIGLAVFFVCLTLIWNSAAPPIGYLIDRSPQELPSWVEDAVRAAALFAAGVGLAVVQRRWLDRSGRGLHATGTPDSDGGTADPLPAVAPPKATESADPVPTKLAVLYRRYGKPAIDEVDSHLSKMARWIWDHSEEGSLEHALIDLFRTSVLYPAKQIRDNASHILDDDADVTADEAEQLLVEFLKSLYLMQDWVNQFHYAVPIAIDDDGNPYGFHEEFFHEVEADQRNHPFFSFVSGIEGLTQEDEFVLLGREYERQWRLLQERARMRLDRARRLGHPIYGEPQTYPPLRNQ